MFAGPSPAFAQQPAEQHGENAEYRQDKPLQKVLLRRRNGCGSHLKGIGADAGNAIGPAVAEGSPGWETLQIFEPSVAYAVDKVTRLASVYGR